jgi:spore coat polysaccharide biosynthesis protein SpsF
LNSIINIVTVIQARAGSSRLPNKVLLALAGKNVLVRMIERVKSAKLAGEVVVATTFEEEDNQIERICKMENINCFRGHTYDLLDRHLRVGLKYDADIIVKIPSDCPLIDPKIIDKVIKYFLDNQERYDYVSNLHPATFPDGNDIEVITMQALKKSWGSARKNYEREHTTPFIWENPGMFKIGNVEWETNLDFSMTHRWTLDYEEDYRFVKEVFDELYNNNPLFGINDILNLLKRKPGIAEINNKYAGVNWYRNHLAELKTINPSQAR